MPIHRRGLLQVAAGAMGATAAAARAAEPAAPSKAWSASAPGKYGPPLETLRQYVEQHRRDFGLPGLTLCIVDADGYTGFITSGWADVERRIPVGPQHVFQIGSISKSMTSLCVWRAIQDGKVKLDDDIRQALPGFTISTEERVTVQTVLNHSSGLPDDPPLFPRVTEGAYWLGFKPTTRWSYSNAGYDMLGKVAERIRGRHFEDIVEAEVLRPLGMNASHGAIREEDRGQYAVGHIPFARGLPCPRRGALAPSCWLDVTFSAGSIASTPGDMGKYMRWLISAGRGKGAPILPDEAAKTWTQPTVDAPGWGMPGAKYANGLAVVTAYDRTYLHHTGGMTDFSSSIHVDVDAGIGCFASTNMGSTGYRPRDITGYACELLRTARDGGKAPTPKPTTIELKDGGKYAGTFLSADGEKLEVTQGPGALMLIFPGGKAALEPSGDDQFIAAHSRFERYALLFEMKDSKPVAIWFGDREYAADPSKLRGPAPDDLRVLAGRYDNDDPWAGSVRIVARPTGLFADGVLPLVKTPDGWWRMGPDDWNPERIWFDAPLSGKTQRMSMSGLDFLRREDRD